MGPIIYIKKHSQIIKFYYFWEEDGCLLQLSFTARIIVVSAIADRTERVIDI
jgi:hypothetical protein